MPENSRLRHAVECLTEADDAVDELRRALAGLGVVLPSLRLDPVSYARTAPCPLVELGRCSVEAVQRMTAALSAAPRTPE